MNGINNPFGLKSGSSTIGSATATLLNVYPIFVDPVTHRTPNQNIIAGDPVLFNARAENPGILPLPDIADDDIGNALPMLGVFSGANTSPTNPYPGLVGPTQSSVPAGYYTLSPMYGWVMDDYTSTFIVQVSTSDGDYDNTIFKWNWIGANALLRKGGLDFDLDTVPAEYGAINNNPAEGNPMQGNSVYYLDGSTVSPLTNQGSPDNSVKNVRIRGVALPFIDVQFASTDAEMEKQTYLSTLIVGENMPFVNLIVQINNAQFNPGVVNNRALIV